MARRTPGARSELIHCDSCGEDYSSTYKRCPFCGEKRASMEQTQPLNQEPEDDYVFEGSSVFDELEEEREERPRRPRGGKRLAESGQTGSRSRRGGSGSSARTGSTRGGSPRTGRSRSGGSGTGGGAERLFAGLSPVRLAGFIFTLVVIIAALIIVTRFIIPMINRGSTQVPVDDQPGQSQSVEPTGSPSAGPDETGSPEPTDSPEPEPTNTVPAGQTATGFTLDRTEFTISDRYPNPVKITATLTPAGSTGTITWTSSDESVVTVDQTGLVTAVGKGSATITATLPVGITQTCRVISSVSKPTAPAPSASPAPSPSASPAPSPSPSANASGGLTLSREDFTMNDTWPSYTFEVTGATGTVTWTTSDAAVATVDPSGKVTKVGTGTCTVTATDSTGKSAQCIVRCK